MAPPDAEDAGDASECSSSECSFHSFDASDPSASNEEDDDSTASRPDAVDARTPEPPRPDAPRGAAADSDASTTSGSDADASTSDAESDSDDEPMLSYARVGASVPSALESADDATCAAFAANGKLALGLRSGLVLVVDGASGETTHRTRAHPGRRVEDVSMDATGAFVASCADDGVVVVHALVSNGGGEGEEGDASTTAILRIVCEHSIKTVAIDPLFASKRARRVVYGGVTGELALNGRAPGAGETRASSTLHAGEGVVRLTRWAGDLIAWANDLGVKLYDVQRRQRVAFIDKPRGTPKPEEARSISRWFPYDRVGVVNADP